MEEEKGHKPAHSAALFGRLISEQPLGLVSETTQNPVSEMQIEDEDPLSYLRDAAPQYGATADDLAESLRKQRAYPVLKNKLRKVPLAVMNRRHRKLREVEILLT